jgi:lipopolysaccharide transport system ATP-binding protein
VQAPFRRLSSVVRGQSSAVSDETIWALKDVSLEVQRGEVVGIPSPGSGQALGATGRGRRRLLRQLSTRLKVLSRITEPTEGYAEIHGRVGSLLEVGSGFNPELIGQEHPGKGFICNLDKDR